MRECACKYNVSVCEWCMGMNVEACKCEMVCVSVIMCACGYLSMCVTMCASVCVTVPV